MPFCILLTLGIGMFQRSKKDIVYFRIISLVISFLVVLLLYMFLPLAAKFKQITDHQSVH